MHPDYASQAAANVPYGYAPTPDVESRSAFLALAESEKIVAELCDRVMGLSARLTGGADGSDKVSANRLSGSGLFDQVGTAAAAMTERCRNAMAALHRIERALP